MESACGINPVVPRASNAPAYGQDGAQGKQMQFCAPRSAPTGTFHPKGLSVLAQSNRDNRPFLGDGQGITLSLSLKVLVQPFMMRWFELGQAKLAWGGPEFSGGVG